MHAMTVSPRRATRHHPDDQALQRDGIQRISAGHRRSYLTVRIFTEAINNVVADMFAASRGTNSSTQLWKSRRLRDRDHIDIEVERNLRPRAHKLLTPELMDWIGKQDPDTNPNGCSLNSPKSSGCWQVYSLWPEYFIDFEPLMGVTGL